MRRRDVIAALLLAATITSADAQQKARVYRIAVVHPSESVGNLSETGSRRYAAFFQRLRELGYIEGQNLSVERYSGEGRTERYAEVAATVVRGRPDLIFVAGTLLTREFKSATDTIPVVVSIGDPVAFGIASSLARPGGNITGISSEAGVEFWGKHVELLREMAPTASRLGYLASRAWWETPGAAAVRVAAQRSKISLVGPLLAGSFQEAEYRRAFAAMTQQGVDALIVSGLTENLTNRRLIVALAAEARLPAIYTYREFADVGGLMAYGVDLADTYRHAAEQIDQILKGAKPGDIPFYQPTKFELVINLKAAKGLGLEIPGSVLARADEVVK